MNFRLSLLIFHSHETNVNSCISSGSYPQAYLSYEYFETIRNSFDGYFSTDVFFSK